MSAVFHLNYLIALEPVQPSLYARRSAAFFAQKHFDKARFDFNRSIQLKSKKKHTNLKGYENESGSD